MIYKKVFTLIIMLIAVLNAQDLDSVLYRQKCFESAISRVETNHKNILDQYVYEKIWIPSTESIEFYTFKIPYKIERLPGHEVAVLYICVGTGSLYPYNLGSIEFSKRVKYQKTIWKKINGKYLIIDTDLLYLNIDNYFKYFVENINDFKKQLKNSEYVKNTLKSISTFDYDIDTTGYSLLSRDDIQRIRYTIYARHGKCFSDPKWREYFRSKIWYKENPNYSDSLLTDRDKRNIRLLRQLEENAKKIHHSRFLEE